MHWHSERLEGGPALLTNGRSYLRGMIRTSAKILGCLLLMVPPDHAMSANCNPSISAVLQNARRTGDASTLLTLPDLGPLESADVEIGGHGRKISLLLRRRSSLNNLLATLNQHRDRSKPLSSIDGLTSFLGTDNGGFTRSETYFASDGDVVTDVLECNPPGSFPSPGCDHWISHGTLLVHANYGRDWLPKWHNIRNTITAAFDRCDRP